MPSTAPVGAHLVGSVPLPDTETVFRTAGAILGERLRRVPDGETGIRTLWVMWQFPKLAADPALEPNGPVIKVLGAIPKLFARSKAARTVVNRLAALAGGGGGTREVKPFLRLRAGVRPEDVVLRPLGYSDIAIESYRCFERLQSDGVIPQHVRFQVSLPTPLAVMFLFPAEHQVALLRAYEDRLLEEVAEIAAVVPPEKLSIQWDTCNEFGILEGVMRSPFGNDLETTRRELLEMLIRLGDGVHRPAEVGYHFCYGDFGHIHYKEPEDTTPVVEVANAVAAGLSRPLNWIHFPVPEARKDAAYFAPLAQLDLASDTEVYAGLVHETDTLEGNRQRIELAQQALHRPFGVATECGMGRRVDRTTIPDLLRLHAKLTTPLPD